MTDGIWISVLSGAGIGAAYGVASWIMTRRALRRPVRSALTAVLGGMMLRLAVATVVLAAVLVLFPVDTLYLVGAFFACYAVSMIVEIVVVHRTPPETAPPRS